MSKTDESELLPCPFCGGDPWFEGDASEWRDEARYVQLSITCCATMTEAIGWREARGMTDKAKTSKLKSVLSKAWNKRILLTME